jgi:uncharacterized protein Smg (DUF494 family)
MNIDELTDNLVQITSEAVIDGEIIENKDEFEEDDDDDESVEADLSNALSLLDDCWSMMEHILEKKESRNNKLNYYQYTELERLCQEAAAFLNQFDINADEGHKSLSWKGDI